MKRRTFIREVVLLSAAPLLWLPRKSSAAVLHPAFNVPFLANAIPAAGGGGGGGIEFVAVAESAAFVITQSPTVTYPSGLASGDIILVLLSSGGHDTSGTPPTGWTKIGERDGADGSASLFWKRSDGTETSEVWTNIFAAAEVGLAMSIAYRGCVASGDPIDASLSEAGAAGTAKDISQSTVTNNAMVVALFDIPNNTDTPFTFTWDAGDVRVDGGTTPDGYHTDANRQVTICDIIKATAGAQAMGGDWSTSGSGQEWWVALKPA